jgi:hypothetical protein
VLFTSAPLKSGTSATVVAFTPDPQITDTRLTFENTVPP